MRVKVLFVCLGNICRSPVGEGIFKHLVEEAGLADIIEVDSAGTGAYHVGELPDKRMRETAYSHGILLNSRARQFVNDDFKEFDYILAMDKSNLRNILSLSSGSDKHVVLMRDYDPTPEDGEVPDPYYGGISGFENVYQIVYRSCEKLLEEIIQKHKLS